MMNIRSLILRGFVLIFSVIMGVQVSAQDAPPATTASVDLAEGETLFKNKCGSCHNKNMKDNMTGPALGGVEERWSSFPRTDLYKWIRNSQAMISEGHPRAVELWNQWKPNIMNNFPELTDGQIDNILAYVQDVYTRPAVTVAQPVPGAAVEEKSDNTFLFVALFVVLGILALVLARIIANLNYMAQVQEGEDLPRRKTLFEILTSKGVIAVAVFALIVIGGFTTVRNAINLGRQQGYQPEQPIKFSHATHAGLHKIDCQYCHDGARRSKQSVIPAANTCMNCHKAIKKGSKYGTAELTKIFASVGYDPKTDKYIEGYENLPMEEVEKIYLNWITENYIADGGSMDAEGELAVKDQWEAIVASLSVPGREGLYGPIEWVRIHNLPDHAYFNHAQHVAVGKVACQTCHGPVEEMEVVQQHSPLSMGWCINCHRKTPVQFAENEYYKSYERYHEELNAGARDQVTVEEIGGLECQKCHY